MSLPQVSLVRQCIDNIEDEPIMRCLQATLLFCARIGEVIAYALPGDSTYKNSKPRGYVLDFEETVYTPNIMDPNEILPLLFNFLSQGKSLAVEDLALVREPVVVFTVATHKRHGKIRSVALPLNPDYEPWSQLLLQYFKERRKENQPIFPFNRQEMWTVSKQVFKGLKYKIEAYKKREKSSDGTPTKIDIPEHMRPFRLHALRHLRSTELANFYGFTGVDRSAYGGWTLATTERVSASQDRYIELQWRKYFPKLLKTRRRDTISQEK